MVAPAVTGNDHRIAPSRLSPPRPGSSGVIINLYLGRHCGLGL